MSASACGLWLSTMTANTDKHRSQGKFINSPGKTPTPSEFFNARASDSLRSPLPKLPTLTATDDDDFANDGKAVYKVNSKGGIRKINGNGTEGSVPLTRVVHHFLPTLLAEDADGRGPGSKRASLGSVKHKLPTLTVHGNHNARGASPKSGDGLSTAVKRHLPTLTAQDAKNDGGPSTMNRKTQPLNSLVKEHENAQGALNPDWCEWFMGFPPGWTHPERPVDREAFSAWLANLGHQWDDWPAVPALTMERKHRRGRIRALGNAQVPLAAMLAFIELWHQLTGQLPAGGNK